MTSPPVVTSSRATAAAGLRGARRLLLPRLSASVAQRVVTAAIAPMVAVTVWLAVVSDHLQRPAASALYWGWLTGGSMAIGLFWWVRRPASRFGPLLIAFGACAWVVSWQSSESPLLFGVGVLAETPAVLLTFYLFAAFPMGRLEPPAARWLIVALAVGLVQFYVLWALFSPQIGGTGPLVACGDACPEHLLQVGTAPQLVDVALHVEVYTALAVAFGVLLIYLRRLLTATRPQRRALMAVGITSLAFLPAFVVFHFSRVVLELPAQTLESMQWAVVATRVLLPVGFLVALLQADEFAGAALRKLLERLTRRPSPERWREIVASALDDPALRLGYHDPATGRFREPDGDELEHPAAGSGRAWVAVEREGRAVAALVLDETLTENPELIDAAVAATLLAVENGALEGELRASRARILEAGHAERRRIERDLHDSAQQRLVALRIHLALTGEQLARSEDRAMLDRLGAEVDETIDELRSVARGLYPPLLAQDGIGAALVAVALRSAMPIRVEDHNLARHPEAIEMTIYFCCLECLQNAAKHAGPRASAVVRLKQADGRITFDVEDDGVGFAPGAGGWGAGLTNLADRVAAVGGTLRIESAPGHGTRITGVVPV